MSVLRLTGFNPERGFGIELEVLWPASYSGSNAQKMGRLETALTAAGIDVYSVVQYYHSAVHAVTSRWKIVPDGSVHGGCEVVSPPMRSGVESLAELETVCGVLGSEGFKVDRSCGLHIHHEGRDLDAKAVSNLARLSNRFQPIIGGLLPRSRRGNQTYTKPFSAAELLLFEKAKVAHCGLGSRGRERDYSICRVAKRVQRFSSYDARGFKGLCCACASETRYKALNIRSLHQHGTVEFRQHSGTVEYEKALGWLLLTQGLVEKAKAGGRSRRKSFEKLNGDGLKNLLRASGLQNCKPHGQTVDPRFKALTTAACRYFRARAKKFAVLNLGDNAAARSRAAATTAPSALSPRERVEAAVSPVTTTNQSAS